MQNFSLPNELNIKPREGKARFGYTHATTYESGLTVMHNPGRPDMGAHVVISGATLRNLEQSRVIDWMAQALKITRLDIAVDIRNGGWTRDKIKAALDAGSVKTSARTISNWSTWSEAGETVYFGRKSSSRMTRIYDKGAESGEGGDWWRIETVFKHPHATQALLHLKSATATATALIRGHVDISEDWFTDAMVSDPVLTVAGKPKNATKKWLLEQAAPALAKIIWHDDDHAFFLDFSEHVKRLVEELEEMGN